jgi:hypothetical protein
VDTTKFCQKYSTKVLPLVNLIPLVERDNNKDNLVYKDTFKKKKRATAVNNKEIPSIISSSSSTSSSIDFGTSASTSSIIPGCAISTLLTTALEVKNKRAKATLEDYVTTKEANSKYSVNPKNIEKQVAEI